MAQLQIKTALQISRSTAQVFGAIVDPQKMTRYFISEASRKMEEGKTISWQFPEFEESVAVHVQEWWQMSRFATNGKAQKARI